MFVHSVTIEFMCLVLFVRTKVSVKDLQLQIKLVNPLKPSGRYMYHQFNIQRFYVLPTLCIYMFRVDLRTNSDYFPIQH